MMLLIVFLAAIAAFTVSGIAGGGAGLALIPVLRMGLTVSEVPVALSLGSAVSSFARIGLFLGSIQWRVVRWFVPFSLPGACVGVWLVAHVSAVYMEVLLGLFLLANLPWVFRRPDNPSPASSLRVSRLAIVGLLAGFLSGLTGAVGLLFNRFYLRAGMTRTQVVATRAANEILLHLFKLVLYIGFGLFTRQAAMTGLVLGAGALLATLGARRLLPLLSEALFRRIGYASMVLAGAVMTVNATTALAATHDLGLTMSRVKGGVNAYVKGFDKRVTVEFRRGESPEIEYRIPIDELPAAIHADAMALIAGADSVVVEKVRSWKRTAFELYVHRDGSVLKHDL